MGDVKIDRLVEVHPTCFLFGHYDSRGGATLMKAPNLIEAVKKYITVFGISEEDEHEDIMIHNLIENDFLHSVTVMVCDEAISPTTVDLDKDYGGKYNYGLIKYTWEESPPLGWLDLPQECGRTLVLWKGKKPKVDNNTLPGASYLPGLKSKITKLNLGEDACGLIWQTEAV